MWPPKSPAAEAGLQEGDVVVEMSGPKIKDSRNLRFLIAQTASNTKVNLLAWRDGKE